jgi:hypothetical protein
MVINLQKLYAAQMVYDKKKEPFKISEDTDIHAADQKYVNF